LLTGYGPAVSPVCQKEVIMHQTLSKIINRNVPRQER
jgi:hypothetical protein